MEVLKGSQTSSVLEYSGLSPGDFSLSQRPPGEDLGAKSLHGTQCDFLIFALCWIFSIFKYDAFIVMMMMMVIVCCVCYVDCMMMMHNVALVSSGISTTRVNEWPCLAGAREAPVVLGLFAKSVSGR